jgi:hypothetical protein
MSRKGGEKELAPQGGKGKEVLTKREGLFIIISQKGYKIRHPICDYDEPYLSSPDTKK